MYNPLNFGKGMTIEEKNTMYQSIYLSELPETHPFSVQRDISTTREFIPLHSHGFYEIVFVKSGNINYILDSSRFSIKPGDIILIPPGLSHQPLFMEELTEPYERIAVWISASLLEEYAKNDPAVIFVFEQCKKRNNYLLRSTPATWQPLFSGFESLLKELEYQRYGYQSCTKFTLFAALIHLGRTIYYQDNKVPSESDTPLDSIITYIDTHIDEKITLDSVSKDLHISKSYITHTLPQTMGTSFYRCLIQRRLILVKNNILSGMPLQQAWENCGFSDYSTFYRAFTKEYGMSPKKYQTAAINRK